MESRIECKPDYSLLQVTLQPGERLVTESGAMVAMDGSLRIETGTRGGIMQGLKRKILGAESLFINTYIAQEKAARVWLAPKTSGDLEKVHLDSHEFFLQSGAFVASSEGVSIDTKWGGIKTFFGVAGLFLLKCSGSGDLWFNSYGGLRAVDVEGSLVVDTGAVVAFEDTLRFKIRSVGGMKSLLFSGEGLICDFSGVGRLYLQTRLPAAFAGWAQPFRQQKRSNH